MSIDQNVAYWGDRCCKAEAELNRLRSEFNNLRTERNELLAALVEIAGDPTVVSSFQADIARAAIAKAEGK